MGRSPDGFSQFIRPLAPEDVLIRGSRHPTCIVGGREHCDPSEVRGLLDAAEGMAVIAPTDAVAAASPLAIPTPMPLDAPVTKATLPSNLNMGRPPLNGNSVLYYSYMNKWAKKIIGRH